MAKGRFKRMLLILLLVVIVAGALSPANAATPGNRAIEEQVESLASGAIQRVDKAILVLTKGWAGMNPAERALFNQLYDPGDTGDVDEKFVAAVLANYEEVRRRLENFPTVAFRPDSPQCEGQRLYYTDLFKIYICPNISVEESAARKERVLIHEAVHMALLSGDRAYFHKNTYSTRYEALTPRGPWTTAIPLLGPIFREMARSDTLYHPDAYAWFAAELGATDDP